MAGHPNYPASSPFMPGGGTTGAHINVTANVQPAVNAFSQLQGHVSRFATGISRAFGGAGRGFDALDLHLRRINANMVAAGFAVHALVGKFEDFVRIGAEMEQLTVRVRALSLSTIEANKTTERLLTLARQEPYSLNAITKAFIKLKSAGIAPIVDANGGGPLKDLLDAVAALGGASDEILDRVAIAISQMAGKGVVSMEELRQQLGEALPTALRILARESGLTVKALVKEISRGQYEFKRFQELFFKGLRKDYEGMGTLLTHTFLGALGQTRTEMQNLSNVIFNQTGVLDKFTAAILIANKAIAQFSDFLKTPQGQQWIDKIWQTFKNVALYAEKAVSPIGDVASAFSDMLNIISHSTDGLPPEIVGGGLIGYVLFGPRGGAALAILFEFSKVVKAITEGLSGLVNSNTSLVENIIGDTISGLTPGLIGYLMFGPAGALLALAGTIYNQLTTKLNEFVVGAVFITKYAAAGFGAFKSADDVIRDMGLNGVFDAMQKLKDIQSKGDPQSPLGNFFASIDQKAIEEKIKGTQEKLMELRLGIKSTGDEAAKAGDSFAKMQETVSGTTTTVTQGIQDQKVSLDDIIGAAGKAVVSMQNLGKTTEDAASKNRWQYMSDYVSRFRDSLKQAESAGVSYSDVVKLIDANIAGLQKQYDSLNRIDKTGQFGKDIQQTIGWLDQWKSRYEQIAEGASHVADQVSSSNQKAVLSYNQLVIGLDSVQTSIQELSAGVDNGLETPDTIRQSGQIIIDQINEYKDAVANANITDQQRAELLKVIAEQTDIVNAVTDAAIATIEKSADAKTYDAKATAEVARSVSDLSDRAKKLILGARFDEEAQRMAAAKADIENILQDIAVQIEDIQKKSDKGLISPEAANAAINNLNQIASAVQANASSIIEAASTISQAWQEMGKEIYQSIQTSLGDAIYGLVTKTKSLRDVMVDLWNSITRAVSNYLAKVIMAGLFGGGGNAFGGAGLLGGLFGGGGGLGFATGGSFTVDGRTGLDNNLVAFRASRGERVTVSTPGQQSNMGSNITVNISAIDSRSVKEMFMREGSSLQRALDQRIRLNHA